MLIFSGSIATFWDTSTTAYPLGGVSLKGGNVLQEGQKMPIFGAGAGCLPLHMRVSFYFGKIYDVKNV